MAASCAALSPSQELAAARVVFLGRMLPGASARLDGREVLGSPAAVRVGRYLKGHGPRTAKVATAITITSSGIIGAEDGIEPQVGEIWKIYAQSRHQPFDTSICAGSKLVRSSVRVALDLWTGFPVQARPRPIVPLGEGIVLDPRTGFPNDQAKLAYSQGRFALRARLPSAPVTRDRFAIVSAADAYARLRSAERSGKGRIAALVISAVRLRTATFVTDRGRRRLPAWQFSFKGVATPASVLALAPPDVFTVPALEPLGPTGPGNSIEDAATADRSDTRITISFLGAPAGDQPCDARYVASAVTSRRAVAFAIKTIPVPVPSGAFCTAVGYTRTAVLHLTRPLGPRVLISATDGGGVPVTRGG